MNTLTKKYIFACKLKDVPVEIDTGVLYHKGILKLLLTTGVWKKDPAQTDKSWNEYSFTIIHPMRLIDDDGNANLLLEGYHHLVCL